MRLEILSGLLLPRGAQMRKNEEHEPRVMTAAQFRQQIKLAFEAGFLAAQSTRCATSWENSELRKSIDHHCHFEQITQPVASSPVARQETK